MIPLLDRTPQGRYASGAGYDVGYPLFVGHGAFTLGTGRRLPLWLSCLTSTLLLAWEHGFSTARGVARKTYFGRYSPIRPMRHRRDLDTRELISLLRIPCSRARIQRGATAVVPQSLGPGDVMQLRHVLPPYVSKHNATFKYNYRCTRSEKDNHYENADKYHGLDTSSGFM